MGYYAIATPDGQTVRLPSVTTILDVTMAPDRKAQLLTSQMSNSPAAGALRQQVARDTGNEIDRWLKKCFEAQKLMPAPEHKAAFVRKALPWLRKLVYGAAPCWVDRRVWSLTHGFAGTLDAIAPHPAAGGLVLYEFKTSRYKVWDIAVHEAELQSAAYALAWRELNEEIPLKGLCTVHITPYELQENLITDIDVTADLQGLFLLRLRQFGARLSGGEEIIYG